MQNAMGHHDPAASLAKAEGLRIAGKFEAAEVLYRQYLGAQPDNAAAWHGLGQMAFACGKFEPAAAFCSTALIGLREM